MLFRSQTLFVPFFLEGAVGLEGMIQDDGIHPTEKAQPIMAQWVEQAVRPWVNATRSERQAD